MHYFMGDLVVTLRVNKQLHTSQCMQTILIQYLLNLIYHI